MSKLHNQALRLAQISGLILFMLASGCSATRPLPSKVAQEAEAAVRKGISAEENGKSRSALAAFSQALDGYASIEDNYGVAMTLVNISRIERRLKMLDSATSHLDRALALQLNDPSLNTEIAFEKALLLVSRQQPVEALAWAQRALAAAPREERGRVHNLTGRILLLQGEKSRAGEEARQALSKLADDELSERANAHRLLGEIALADRDVKSSESEYRQALALDKEAGICSRIAEDLQGLSRVELTGRNTPEALKYLRRALTVASAGGETRLAIELLAELAELYRAEGQAITAQRLDEERQRLVLLVGAECEAAAANP